MVFIYVSDLFHINYLNSGAQPQRLILFHLMNHYDEAEEGLLKEYDTLGETLEKDEACNTNKTYPKRVERQPYINKLWMRIWTLLRSLMSFEQREPGTSSSTTPSDVGNNYLPGVLPVMNYTADNLSTFMNYTADNLPAIIYRSAWAGFTGELSFALLSPFELFLFYFFWPLQAVIYYLSVYHSSLVTKIILAVLVAFQVMALLGSQPAQISRSLFVVKEPGLFLSLNPPGHSFHHTYTLHFTCSVAFFRTYFYNGSKWECWGWLYWALLGLFLLVIVLQPLLWFLREIWQAVGKKGGHEATLTFIENCSLLSDAEKNELLRLGGRRVQAQQRSDQHEQSDSGSYSESENPYSSTYSSVGGSHMG